MYISLVDINVKEWLEGILAVFKQLGWERGLFILFVAFLEWRIHGQYKKNIDDKQAQIDRLEKQNNALLTRLTKILDRKHKLK